jgi:hypothetical protein
MTVIETTNAVLDYNVSAVHTRSVPTFVRALVANAQAVSGRQWTDIFARENSGTVRASVVSHYPPAAFLTIIQYNNQWMIIDYSLFTPFAPLPDGTLWIIEQIPGRTRAADVTEHLRRNGRYAGQLRVCLYETEMRCVNAVRCSWVSYNLPFFADISRDSGIAAECERDEECVPPALLRRRRVTPCRYCHHDCARARIFAREMAAEDVTLQRMQAVMRLNNWKHDPLSGGDPGNQLSGVYSYELSHTTSANARDAQRGMIWTRPTRGAEAQSTPRSRAALCVPPTSQRRLYQVSHASLPSTSHMQP